MLEILLVLALLLPASVRQSPRPILVGSIVALAYSLGVRNERAFPGGRVDPMPGEELYWLFLCALIFVAGASATGRRGNDNA